MAFLKKETEYKTSWYDGWFFANFSDKNSEKALHLNSVTAKFISDNSNVLDIGCGTGSLAVSLAEKCKSVQGVDVSPRMITYAKKHSKANSNIKFHLIKRHEKLSDLFDQKFEYSILKLVLHEMPEEERANLIDEAKGISQEIIITEWLAPQPKNLSGKGTFLIEMMSNVEHFKNFKIWHSTGGIDGFLERHGLTIVQEELFVNKTGKIVKVNW